MATEIHILYEDNHLLAVNKPAGWLVHSDQTGDFTLADWAKNYIKTKYEKPGEVFLGVVHRIDRPVSGVVLFCRTSKALERMNKLFHDRKVEKEYWAVVQKRPDPLKGHLSHYLWKDETKNIARLLDQPSRRHPDAKKSELDYELLAEINSNFLIKINPITGRSHQIRAQMASIGCPIRGDLKYGANQPNADQSINLHCRNLTFEHPVKSESVSISAPLPNEQAWKWFRAFGK